MLKSIIENLKDMGGYPAKIDGNTVKINAHTINRNKKYNLYFNVSSNSKWQWRNKTIDQIKNIIFNQYSILIKFIAPAIYNDILLDFKTDRDFSKLTYFKDNKVFISICEVKRK